MPRQRGSPWDDLRKILHGVKRIAKEQNGEEILPKVSTPWVGRTNTTDDRRICDSKEPNVKSRSGKNWEQYRLFIDQTGTASM